jgi:hypothetical protein
MASRAADKAARTAAASRRRCIRPPRSSFVRGDANDDEWYAPRDPATHAVTSRFGRHYLR